MSDDIAAVSGTEELLDPPKASRVGATATGELFRTQTVATVFPVPEALELVAELGRAALESEDTAVTVRFAKPSSGSRAHEAHTLASSFLLGSYFAKPVESQLGDFDTLHRFIAERQDATGLESVYLSALQSVHDALDPSAAHDAVLLWNEVVRRGRFAVKHGGFGIDERLGAAAVFAPGEWYARELALPDTQRPGWGSGAVPGDFSGPVGWLRPGDPGYGQTPGGSEAHGPPASFGYLRPGDELSGSESAAVASEFLHHAGTFMRSVGPNIFAAGVLTTATVAAAEIGAAKMVGGVAVYAGGVLLCAAADVIDPPSHAHEPRHSTEHHDTAWRTRDGRTVTAAPDGSLMIIGPVSVEPGNIPPASASGGRYFELTEDGRWIRHTPTVEIVDHSEGSSHEKAPDYLGPLGKEWDGAQSITVDITYGPGLNGLLVEGTEGVVRFVPGYAKFDSLGNLTRTGIAGFGI